MREVRIYYIGKKPYKKDTVANSGIEWNGYGDSQVVPENVAQKLVKFPQVWVNEKVFEAEHADTEQPAPSESTASAAGGGLDTLPVVNTPPNPAQSTDDTTLIKEAIRKLDRGNKDHFTGPGMPKIAAVRAELPQDFELNAKTLNQVFDQIKDEFRTEG